MSISAPVEVSIVVPLFNEEESVRPMFQHVVEALRDLERSFEIIFVDDGSDDATFDLAKTLVEQNPELRVIRFRRNFGQTPAMVAGMDFANGEIIVTMDGDLQNDARDIGSFLEKMDEGYDLVVGWRQNRQDKLVTRKIPSKVANWLIAKITGVKISDNGCSLKAYRASVIRNIPLYSEMHRFIPAMNSLAGVRLYELKVRHHARKFGTSKYGLARVYKVLIDLLSIRAILSTLAGPIRYFGLFAFGLMSIAFLVGIASLLFDSFIFLSVAVISGAGALSFLFWGILCELIVFSGDIRADSFAKLTAIQSSDGGRADV